MHMTLPAACVAGTPEEMRRLPTETMEGGFSGDHPDDRDLITGKVPGRTRDDQTTFRPHMGNRGLQFSSVGGLVRAMLRRAGLIQPSQRCGSSASWALAGTCAARGLWPEQPE